MDIISKIIEWRIRGWLETGCSNCDDICEINPLDNPENKKMDFENDSLKDLVDMFDKNGCIMDFFNIEFNEI